MKVIGMLLFVSMLAVSAHGQVLQDGIVTRAYSSPDMAVTDASHETNPAAVIPVGIVPQLGAQSWVTYTVVTQAEPSDTCATPADSTTAPVVWFGTPSCGYGLGGPVVQQEPDYPSVQNFLATLTALQRQTAVVIRAVGNQFAFRRWWVVYQPNSAFCE